MKIEDVYPLSPLQEGMYYHWLNSPSSYFAQMSYQLKGALQVELLEKSYEQLIARHAILRTSFTNKVGKELLQVVKKEGSSEFNFIDASADKQFSIEGFKEQDQHKGFNLEKGSQMRLTVVKLGEHTYEFMWSYHHILMDGWCAGILIKEFFYIYSCLVAGKKTLLGKVYPYSIYIKWLLKRDKKVSADYWREYLSGYDTISTLPKLTNTASAAFTLEKKRFALSEGLSRSLKVFCAETGITENTFIQTLWGILLSKYNAVDDVVFGAVVSGRPPEIEGIEEMVGLFINTIPVRIRFDKEQKVIDLLKQAQKEYINGINHHYTQLAEIQAESELERELLDHIVVFENYPVQEMLENSMKATDKNDSLEFSATGEFEHAHYDLSLVVASGEPMRFMFKYNAFAYSEAILNRIQEHFIAVVTAVAENPEIQIGKIDYLNKEEKQQLLFEFSNVETISTENKTIVQLFEEQVSKTPDKTALAFESITFTYKELNEKADQLAYYLRENCGIQTGDAVGVLLDRSEKLMIAILGILKSGAAYVPIEPDFPAARKEFILSDTAAKVLITQTDYIFDLTYYQGNIFAMDAQLDTIESTTQLSAVPLQTTDLAYIMYTSGSTGNPKGVMVEHKSVTRLVKSTNFFTPTEKEIVLSTGSISFDATTFEYWSMLLNGGCLVICPNQVLLDPKQLSEEIKNKKVTMMWFTSGWFNQLVDWNLTLFETLTTILVGGDKLSPTHINKVKAQFPWLKIINGYGPTENTTFSLTYEVNSDKNNIPVGKPIKNSTAYILGEKGNLAAIGVVGEICVGGNGLARGYLNNPELTAEKFVLNPFNGERMYKTGDLGRWMEDGNIEYIGRKDAQIKIRGYRVELGEIENALTKHDSITSATVIAKTNKNSEKELVAYIVSDRSIEISELRDYLSKTLPAYMLPDHCNQLEAMPLTTNGKVDRKQLPELTGSGSTSLVPFVAPRNETEEKLLKIWEEILGKNNISVKNDFFELGGHSLRAIRLISGISKQFNIHIALKDLFSNSVLEDLARLITASDAVTHQAIAPVPVQESYPLSSSQRRLWVLSQFEEGNIAYNISGGYVFEGHLDKEALNKSFHALIERHEILRTTFDEDKNGEIRQYIKTAEAINFTIDHKDFRKEKKKEKLTAQYIQSSFSKPFDLKTGPLLRAEVYQLTEKKSVFTYTMHHIISDGWSMKILLNELLAFYHSFTQGAETSLKPLSIHYKDYASWQQAGLNSGEFDKHKNYWLKQFEGALPVLEFPSDHVRPAVKTYNGSMLSFKLEKPVSEGIKSLCKEQGATLFMGLLAGINTLLYHYTQQEDIIIGSPVAGRNHADLEDQIGFYINTLALRTQFKETDNYKKLLENIKQVTLNAFEHQAYPLDELIDQLELQRDLSRSALFDVMVVLQNTELAQSSQQDAPRSLEIKSYDDGERLSSKFDLGFEFSETGDEISLGIEYNTDLFNKETIVQIAAHLKQLFVAIINEPVTPIGQLNFLNADEQNQLLEKFNSTTTPYMEDKTLVELFEAQVKDRPQDIALVFEEDERTYAYLNERSNQLANYLQSKYKAGQNDLIGINLERSEWLVISILAVLKTGGAYVPIDPGYPQERIDYMVEDSKCKVVIDEAELLQFIKLQDQYSKSDLKVTTKVNDLAYVIYTSGSTGKPKGCMLEHRGVVNRLEWMWNQYDFTKADIILQKTTFTFDVSVWELFLPLCFGAKMVLCGKEDIASPTRIASLIKKQKVTCLHFVPGMLNVFISTLLEDKKITAGLKSLKKVITSGEALPLAMVKNWYEKIKTPIHNLYGPTEASVDVTYYPTKKEDKKIPIGKPIWNTQMYVLGKHDQLLPIGVTGEIVIAGIGLARGYLNKPELTTEKFVKHPFKAGERIYKTGDLGRWLPDGNIEYIGRKDDQVKIRGYRIELGEIENALSSYNNIAAAVVTVKNNKDAEKELVAYLVSDSELNTADIRSYLSKILPSYMLPAHYVQLPELPLSPNGKIDRKKLPLPEGLNIASGIEYIAPRTNTEEKLASIWEELLGKNKIGVKDNFFELGGHSLKATRLISQLQKQFQVKLDLKDIFTNAHLEEQARLIEGASKISYAEIPLVTIQSSYPLSSAQSRLWVLSQFEEGNLAYNMPATMNLEGTYDLAVLQKAFDRLIDRHEILRTVFKTNDQGEIRQWVLNRADEEFQADGYRINYKDFTELANKQEQVQRYIDEDAYQVFDLEKGPLLRAALLQVEKEQYVFYFNMHHIISDGWSMGVVSKELFAFYKAYEKNKKKELKTIDPTTVGLKELRIQYKDYSAWQLSQLQEEEFATHRNYWLNNLSGKLPLLDLPGRKQRPKLKTNNGRMLSTYLNKEASQNLKKYSQAKGGTLFMGLLASLNTAFYLYTWQTDQIIGSPVAGREHLDLEDQIGFYVNTLALRTTINPVENFDELFSKVKQATLESYVHQLYPFDRLVNELELARDTSRSAVFDVMLVLQNNRENTSDADPAAIGSMDGYVDQIVDLGSRMTKFDLLINVQEQGNYLHLAIEYNTDVYEKEVIERFIDHYKSIVLKVTSDPKQQLGKIDYLSTEEKQELLHTFNDTAIDYGDKTVMELVEEQVARTPDKIALEFEEKNLTYKQLNQQSNCLAHVLKDSYQQSNTTRVGVMLERSLESVIAMIGVMKTGACYVPIDHEYPTERVKYIIEDSGLDIIVSRDHLFKKHNIRESTLVEIATIDFENGVKSNLESTNQPEDGSYVIYTSGSTGKPKGVLQTHRMMSNLIQWDIHHSGIATGLKYLQYASFSFDASLHDLYFILSCGGSAYIVNEASRLDYSSLKEQIINNGIEVISMPFSALNAFCIETDIEQMNDHNIKYIVSTAEQLYVNEGLKTFLENNPGVELHNHYGPSESHVVTSYRMSPAMNNMVSRASIGKPISNSTIYILNTDRKLVPKGVEGEVYIGGANLATGYLNKETLTKERFIHSEYEEEKLYKTGDQAYWRSDGNIEYIGRKDDQVKIRGYRIELGEIEHALQSHKEIEEAVVLAREQDKEKELVAYITSKQPQNTTDLRTYLKGILPEYMLPVYYVQLESLPLTGNGKIDKKALPDPIAIGSQGLGLTSGIEYVAPGNALEEKLVKIWQAVLQRDNIGIKDDFFALGGHSLKAVRLSTAYQKELAVKIALKDLFANTTIASHVELIEIQNWVETDSKPEELEKEIIETFNF